MHGLLHFLPQTFQYFTQINISAISVTFRNSAISIQKKIRLLVRIWGGLLGLYLGWWASWTTVLAVFAKVEKQNKNGEKRTKNRKGTKIFAKGFTVPTWVVVIVTFVAVFFCGACYYFVFALFSFATTLRNEAKEHDQVIHN